MSGERSDRLDFDDFLTCLLRVAQKCYPGRSKKEEAMQQLLIDNILPLASKRNSTSIIPLLKQPAVESLFKYYEDSLLVLFQFFASSSDQRAKGKNMIKTTSNYVKTFDDQRELIEESKSREKIQNVSSKNMGYQEFLKFANDFGFCTTLGLTTLDLGEIYLSVISFTNFSTNLRQVDFKEFWEALIRCALVAYRDKTNVTTEDKIRGLFLSIWRHLQNCSIENMSGYGTVSGGGFNNYKGGLIRGSQMLNERFVAAWTRDNYRDYVDASANTGSIDNITGNNNGKALGTAANQADKDGSGAGVSGASKQKDAAPAAGASSSQSVPGLQPPAPAPSLIGKLMGLSAASSVTPVPGNAVTGLSAVDDIAFSPQSSSVKTAVAAENKHHSRSLVHDAVEDRDMFVVAASDGFNVKVMINDDDELCSDRRLTARQLRSLLYFKPDIAAMLFDCLLDEGIVVGRRESSEESSAPSRRKTSDTADFSLGEDDSTRLGGDIEADDAAAHREIEELAQSLAASTGLSNRTKSISASSTGSLDLHTGTIISGGGASTNEFSSPRGSVHSAGDSGGTPVRALHRSSSSGGEDNESN